MKNHISAYLLAECHKKSTPYGKWEAACNQTLEIEENDNIFTSTLLCDNSFLHF